MLLSKLQKIMCETPEKIIRRLRKEKGFKKISRGVCEYYHEEGTKYTIIVTYYENTPNNKVLIIVEDAMVKKLDYPRIYLKSRNDGKDVPCIFIEGEKKPKALHRIVYGTEKDIDHINSNIYVCIFSNLRPCTKKQNNKNRRCSAKVEKHYYSSGEYAGYRYEVRLDESQAEELLKLGFTMKPRSRRDGKITLQSPIREEQAMVYRDYAKAERILLKGTDMEQYVYDIENDFSETLNLMIHYYIFHDISEEEMYEMNFLYWEMRLEEEEKYAA